MKKTSAARVIGSGLGLGLAALENQYVGQELPEPLKNVNYGIGGLTGFLATDPDPKIRLAALTSLPFKQLGLFGIGAMDKLRRQQQSLVDANLGVADINRETADIQRSNAGNQRAMQLAFLIPALAGGGAAALWAYDKWKKHQQVPRYKTLGEKGRSSSARSKIRIDIPTSAVPAEFYKTLSEPEEQNKAHIRLMQLSSPEDRRQAFEDIMASLPQGEVPKMAAFIKRATSDGRISTPRFLFDMASEMTGIPSAYRSVKDFGLGFQNFEDDNARSALRYGLGGLGNAALALATFRLGAPAMAKLIGYNRLMRHAGLAENVGTKGIGLIDKWLGRAPIAGAAGHTTLPGKFPWYAPQFKGFSNFLLKHTQLPGQPMSAFEAQNAKRFAYNPEAFGWGPTGPSKTMFDPVSANTLGGAGKLGPPALMTLPYGDAGGSAVGKGLRWMFSSPNRPVTTVPGQFFNLGRYGVNRAMQGAYGLRQFAGRSPNATLFALGSAPAMMGSLRDDSQDARARSMLKGYVPDWASNRGAFGMPLTGTMGNIAKLIGLPDNASGIRNQIMMPRQFTDPFDWRH